MSKKNKGPKLPIPELYYAAGIDPKTGKPLPMKRTSTLKKDVLRTLEIIDRQDAVNRGTWYNLPTTISSQELERLLYLYGQLAFFYYEPLDTFFFMKYTLDGTLDFYGRFNQVHPLPIFEGEKPTAAQKKQKELLAEYKLKVVHSILLEEPNEETMTKSCVLLHDYSKGMSETIVPRCQLNAPILDAMAECIPFMMTSLLNNTGVKGMRVADANSSGAVLEANYTFKDAALNQLPNIPIVGNIEFQELTGSSAAKAEEYMLALQSLDNFRLSTYGIDNGGLFEKKAHTLEAEMAINGGPVGLVLQDAVSIRQNFCNIVNSIWNLGIWYEPSENITKADANADGVVYDRNNGGNQSGAGDENQEGGNEE